MVNDAELKWELVVQDVQGMLPTVTDAEPLARAKVKGGWLYRAARGNPIDFSHELYGPVSFVPDVELL